jgi:hypothetical protein
MGFGKDQYWESEMDLLRLHMVFRLFPEYHWSVGHSEDIYLERPLLLSYALISTDIR